MSCKGSSEGGLLTKESRLFQHMMNDYSPLARPVINSNTPTNVTFGVEFIQVLEVDERNQYMKTKVSDSS